MTERQNERRGGHRRGEDVETLNKLAVVLHRVDKMEETIVMLGKAIDKIVSLEVHHQTTVDNMDSIRQDIQELKLAVNGPAGSPGLGGKVEVLMSKIENHTWALRTIAAAFVVEIAGAVFWLLKH